LCFAMVTRRSKSPAHNHDDLDSSKKASIQDG
jgi:hypothetical protein